MRSVDATFNTIPRGTDTHTMVVLTTGKDGEIVRLLPTGELCRLWTRTNVLSVGIFICFDPAVSSTVCVLEPPCEDSEPCRT